LGDKDTTENRFALQSYLLGGETEFWRAYRRYAGVLHFVYLTASDPRAFTSDHFQNVKTLQLEPHFEKAMEQAFNPLGVYLNFWQPNLPTSEPHDFTVAMVNDQNLKRDGTLRFVFKDDSGKEASAEELPFSLEPLGAQSFLIRANAPSGVGHYSVEAIATPQDEPAHPVISHRDVILQTAASPQ
jgi:hypothetical protein